MKVLKLRRIGRTVKDCMRRVSHMKRQDLLERGTQNEGFMWVVTVLNLTIAQEVEVLPRQDSVAGSMC